jgi:hypothetical protein
LSHPLVATIRAHERTNAEICFTDIIFILLASRRIFTDAASPPSVSLRSWGLPKVISPHFPSIPVRQVLFPADRFEVGLLHVVKHRISDAFIVQPG